MNFTEDTKQRNYEWTNDQIVDMLVVVDVMAEKLDDIASLEEEEMRKELHRLAGFLREKTMMIMRRRFSTERIWT